MLGENGTPETPDWAPDCRCNETPCVRTKPRGVCIAEQGDEDRDQA